MRHDTHTLAGVSVVSPAMSPDGRQILTRTSKDERVHLWNTDTGKETRSFPPHGTDVQPEWSPDGQHILVTSDAGVQIWNAATGQQVGSIRGEDLANSSIVVSPDGQHILVTSDAGVQIWDVATGKEVGSIRGEENPTAVWSPDARRIVTTSTTGLAHLYADPFTNGRLLEFPDYRSHCVDSNG
jgi:WD40 repeat protein